MPIVQDHIRSALHSYTASGEGMINIFWHTFSTIPNSGSEQDAVQLFVDQFFSDIRDEVRGTMGSNCYLQGMESALSIGGNVFTATSTESSGPGTVTGDALPGFAAAIIQKRTPNGGRSGRGRWYFGGVAEVLTTGSALNGAGQAAYGALASIISQPVKDNGVETWFPAHLMGSSNLVPIVSTRHANRLGTLRRRMVQRGL